MSISIKYNSESEVDEFYEGERLRAFIANNAALRDAVHAYLGTVKPKWWQVHLWIGLERRRWWVGICITAWWPWWFDEALKCGADPQHLRTISLLVTGYASEPHDPDLRKRLRKKYDRPETST